MSKAKATVRLPVVEFSRKGSPDGDVIRRKGVIFRSGDYPEQDFSLTPDELRALAASFKEPIKLDHGHPTTDGPIDFGALESVEVSPDGTTLYGTTATPSWLDEVLGDARWLVSASFDRATKALRRLSLVTRPQITDAELHAAFCAATNTTVPTEEEPMADPTAFDRLVDKLSGLDEADLEGILSALDDDSAEDEVEDEAPEAAATEPTPAEFALQQRIATLEKENRDAKLANFSARAETFVDVQVAAHKVIPAERDRLIDLHVRAAVDDMDHPAEFGAGKDRRKSRLAEFEESIKARSPHNLTTEQVSNFARILGNGVEAPDPSARMSPEKLAKLLSATPAGKAILAAQTKV